MKKKIKPVLTTKEKSLKDLALGIKQPGSEFEKKLAKDIKQIQAKGREVEIPPDFCV